MTNHRVPYYAEAQKRSPLTVVLIVVAATGGGTVGTSALMAVAAKGMLGSLGNYAVEWLLKQSTSPEDLKFQREFAIRRQEAEEAQARSDRMIACRRQVHSENSTRMLNNREPLDPGLLCPLP